MDALTLHIFNDGIGWDDVLVIIQLMMTAYAVIYAQRLIESYYIYRRVCGNKRISVGSKIRFREPTYDIDGEIVAIDFRYVIVKTESTVEQIPMDLFHRGKKVYVV